MEDLLAYKEIVLTALGFVLLVSIASKFHHPADTKKEDSSQTQTYPVSNVPIAPELQEAVDFILQCEFEEAAKRLREAETYYREHYPGRYFRTYLSPFTTAEVYLEDAWKEPEKAIRAYDTLRSVFPGLPPLDRSSFIQRVEEARRLREISERAREAEEFAENILELASVNMEPTLVSVLEAWHLAESLDDSLELATKHLSVLDSLLSEAPNSVKTQIERAIAKLNEAKAVLPRLKKELRRKLRKYIRPKYWRYVEAGLLRLGMNRYEAVCVWGRLPDDINRSVSVYGGVEEQWVYGDPLEGATYLYFDNGVLRSWQEW